MLTQDIILISVYVTFFAYSIWRLSITCRASASKHPKEYPSRAVFRIILLIHFFTSYFAQQSGMSTINYGKISKIVLCGIAMLTDIAVFALSKSVQDFAQFLKRQTPCLTTYFWNFAVPFYFILCCFQSGQIYSITVDSINSEFVFYTTYTSLLALITVSLIYIPFLVFLYEIDSNDIGGERRKSLVIGYIFNAVAILMILATSGISIWLKKMWNTGFLINISHEPIYIMLSFTQDIIDWLIAWAANDTESDPRAESLTLSLAV